MANSPAQTSWPELCGAFLFTIIGGYLDAYAFVAHGGVFANAQTGNIVLLAIEVAKAEWAKALHHLLPIITFSAGVLIVTLLNHRWEEHTNRLRLASAAVEAGVLSTILIWQARLPNSLVVPMIAFAAAVQVTSFGSVGGVSFNSAMTTGNLRKTLGALGHYVTGQKPTENRRTFLTVGTVCVCFLLGALLGGSITGHYRTQSLLVPLAGIVVAAALSRVPPAKASN